MYVTMTRATCYEIIINQDYKNDIRQTSNQKIH